MWIDNDIEINRRVCSNCIGDPVPCSWLRIEVEGKKNGCEENHIGIFLKGLMVCLCL